MHHWHLSEISSSNELCHVILAFGSGLLPIYPLHHSEPSSPDPKFGAKFHSHNSWIESWYNFCVPPPISITVEKQNTWPKTKLRIKLWYFLMVHAVVPTTTDNQHFFVEWIYLFILGNEGLAVLIFQNFNNWGISKQSRPLCCVFVIVTEWFQDNK
jgi:hypothetical protein